MKAKEEFESVILSIVGETLAAKDRAISNLGPDSPLNEQLGLDSLDWAAVVVRLEMETGIDPFAHGTTGDLKTISDLVDLYVAAAR